MSRPGPDDGVRFHDGPGGDMSVHDRAQCVVGDEVQTHVHITCNIMIRFGDVIHILPVTGDWIVEHPDIEDTDYTTSDSITPDPTDLIHKQSY